MPRVLLFSVGSLALALPATQGREVFVPGGVTPLPGGGRWLRGLTAVRGRAVPLIDLRALLGEAGPDGERALLTEHAGQDLAFHVDEVRGLAEVKSLPAASDEALSPALDLPGAPALLHLDVALRQIQSRLDP